MLHGNIGVAQTERSYLRYRNSKYSQIKSHSCCTETANVQDEKFFMTYRNRKYPQIENITYAVQKQRKSTNKKNPYAVQKQRRFSDKKSLMPYRNSEYPQIKKSLMPYRNSGDAQIKSHVRLQKKTRISTDKNPLCPTETTKLQR